MIQIDVAPLRLIPLRTGIDHGSVVDGGMLGGIGDASNINGMTGFDPFFPAAQAMRIVFEYLIR